MYIYKIFILYFYFIYHEGALDNIQINMSVCYSFGSSVDHIFEDLGLRTYAASLNNKSKHDLFGLITGMFLNPCLFFEGVVGAICCSVIFDICSKTAPSISQQVKKIGPRVPQVDAKIGPRGYPPEGTKNKLATPKTTRQSGNQSSNSLEIGSQILNI